MTALVALGPLAMTPLLVWLLMEFGPERSVIFALYWIIPSIIFAIAMPLIRRRGTSLARASMWAAAWAVVITVVVFIGLLFGFTPRVGATTIDAPRSLATQHADSTVRTPAAGSVTRTAILDAGRRHRQDGVASRWAIPQRASTSRVIAVSPCSYPVIPVHPVSRYPTATADRMHRREQDGTA